MNVLQAALLIFCIISGIKKGIVGLTTCTGMSANERCEILLCRVNIAESVCLVCNISRDTRSISWKSGNITLARGEYNMNSNYAGGLVVNGCPSRKYSLKLQRPYTNHTNAPYFCKQKGQVVSKFCLKLEESSSPNTLLRNVVSYSNGNSTPNDNISLRSTDSYRNDTTENSRISTEPLASQHLSKLQNFLATNIWIPVVFSVFCMAASIGCGYNYNKRRKHSRFSSKSIHSSTTMNEKHDKFSKDCHVVMESGADAIHSANAHDANNLLTVTSVTKLKVSGIHEYWQGNFSDGCRRLEKCFVKTLSDEATLHEASVFRSVAKQLANMRNSANVVRLLSLKNEDGRCSMIYENLEYGSLRDFVRTQFHQRGCREEDEFIIQIQQLLTFASNIASAMVFIVSQNFSHPVLSLKKVLLSAQCTCKLYDIYPRDMAMMKINNVIKKKHSRIAWMPPETIFLSTYSSCSDVWSFSVLLWELFSLGETPYAGKSYKDIEQNIRKSVYLSQPLDCPGAVYEVMLQSWVTNETARPSFKSLKHELQNILATIVERSK